MSMFKSAKKQSEEKVKQPSPSTQTQLLIKQLKVTDRPVVVLGSVKQ